MSAEEWAPVRNGNRYCSPLCGMGCTWDQYQSANRRASELCDQLGALEWTPHVWENLGWHYAATKEFSNGWTIRVNDYGDGVYHASFQKGLWPLTRGATPREAVQAELQALREFLVGIPALPEFTEQPIS